MNKVSYLLKFYERFFWSYLFLHYLDEAPQDFFRSRVIGYINVRFLATLLVVWPYTAEKQTEKIT